MRHFCVLLCAAMVVVCALPGQAAVYYGDFDWRQYDGGDLPAGNYVTPIRNQGSLGSCWAFSATAALESQFLIQSGTPGLDLNLSEQHLVCDSAVGMGGHENLALNYIVSLGISKESTLPYISKSTSPLWPLEQTYTAYKISSVNNYCTGGYTTTSEIKNWLESTGPLSCAIYTGDFFDPGTIYSEANAPALDLSLPEWLEGRDDPVALGPDDPVGAINHSVVIVGYKDEPSMSEGGYWIIKNSWGTNRGDDGYAFIKYGNVEKYSRIHALTGNTYTTEIVTKAPIAVDDTFTIDEDTGCVRYSYEGVRINDTDSNTPVEELIAQKVTDPAHGTIELNDNGSFTYTPDPDFCGTDSFKYQLFDGGRYSNLGTVSIDVMPINDAPIAYDDVYDCEINGSILVYTYEGVLANDYDADNADPYTEEDDDLSVVALSSPSHGRITWYTGGAFKYQAAPGFSGTDMLTYQVFDGTELSNVATVLFEVSTAVGDIAVPEPSIMVLLVSAILGLAALRRHTP